MNKQIVMLLFGLGLVGGFFFLSRRASAETLNGAGGVQTPGGGGGGALGRVPFNEAVPLPGSFPGGGQAPLAFEGGRGGPSIQPSLAERKSGQPGRFAPQPVSRPTPQPVSRPAPRAAPARTPVPVRIAQGVFRAEPIPKGGVRRALN